MDTGAQDVTIVRQRRKSLAVQVTPAGLGVRIPDTLDAHKPEAQAFIAESLARPPESETHVEPLTVEQVNHLVADWADRLQVQVMRSK